MDGVIVGSESDPCRSNIIFKPFPLFHTATPVDLESWLAQHGRNGTLRRERREKNDVVRPYMREGQTLLRLLRLPLVDRC